MEIELATLFRIFLALQKSAEYKTKPIILQRLERAIEMEEYLEQAFGLRQPLIGTQVHVLREN